jgi:hypothetical protein
VRTSVRDSTYVQDGILENQTELPMENQDVFNHPAPWRHLARGEASCAQSA